MIALAALLAAQAVADPIPITVPVLRAHVHDWNGRRVAVKGWMHGCAQGCFIGPSAMWHEGRGRFALTADDRLRRRLDAMTGRQAVVQGIVDEFRCAPDAICLDGADTLHVEAVDQPGRRR